jgi:hypothetical protein
VAHCTPRATAEPTNALIRESIALPTRIIAFDRRRCRTLRRLGRNPNQARHGRHRSPTRRPRAELSEHESRRLGEYADFGAPLARETRLDATDARRRAFRAPRPPKAPRTGKSPCVREVVASATAA